MVEKEEEEVESEERPEGESGEGDKPKGTELIDDANLAAKRMEEANKIKKELLDREEELMARKALSGRAEAGTSEVKKEETPAEYSKRVMAGDTE